MWLPTTAEARPRAAWTTRLAPFGAAGHLANKTLNDSPEPLVTRGGYRV